MPSSSASSARDHSAAAGENSELRRSSCSGFARTLARLPASIMEGLSRSVARRRSRPPPTCDILQVDHWQQPHHQGDQAAPPPPPPPFLLPEELFFFSTFEQQYGGRHPFFYGCRLAEALGIARREGKPVFVYLHDPDHPYTELFRRETLCSDVATEFLDANFVSWGAVSGRGEGAAMAASLRSGSFPFCAVVAPVFGDTDSVTVLRQVEGPVTPSELVEILQSTIDEQGAQASRFRPSSNSRAPAGEEEEERRRRAALQQLKREQDAAYLDSLRKDQEKERSRKSLQQEGTLNPKSAGHVAPKETTKPAQIRVAPVQKQAAPSQSHRTELDTKIMIRFPNGERRQQGFHHTDTVREIYRYVGSLGIPGLGNYQLVRSYPRRSYGHQQLEMTLRDAGFHPSVTLYIKQLQ